VLNLGDTATYNAKVENTTDTAMQVEFEVEFEVFDSGGPSSYDYYTVVTK